MRAKILSFIILIFLFSSCEEDEKTGLCIGYDGLGNSPGCANVSAEQCSQYDTDKKDGYNWEYRLYDGSNVICPPPQAPAR